MSFIVQKISTKDENALNQAIKYYSIICLINNIKITKKEVELLGFTAIRGTISSSSSRAEFSRLFDSSQGTINNMVGKLKSLTLLEKVNGKYRVNKAICIDFQHRDLILQIKLTKEPNETERTEISVSEQANGHSDKSNG